MSKDEKDKRDVPHIGCIYSGIKSGGSSYPTGGKNNGFSGTDSGDGISWGNSLSDSKPQGIAFGINRSSIDSSSGLSTFNSIVEMTKYGPQSGRIFMGEKTMNLQNGNLTDGGIGVLMERLQWQGLNLDKFDVSYNKISNGAVENIFYTFSTQRSNISFYNIKFINLSNNQIGDDGARCIASHIGNGHYPNLKALDLSGNQITSNGYSYFTEGMKSPKVENLIVTFVKEAGSKSKKFIKSSLKTFINYAKQQGVDTTDIATDKGTYEYLKSQVIIAKGLKWGYLKCMTYLDYVTDGFNMSDIGYEVMLKKVGKKIPGLHVFTCILQAADEAFTTPEGINLIGKAIEFIEE